MIIAAFGVTGASGRAFVKLALDSGHIVRAVARRPEALGISHPNLSIHKADVTSSEELTPIIAGSDVVVSVLGVSKLLEARKGTTIYSKSSAAIIKAMKNAGTNRFVAVSSGGINPKTSDNWIYKNVLKRFFLEKIYVDMRVMEANMVASGLDYTIVHPPFLKGDKERRDYRYKIGEEIQDDTSLSRWSLGHFLLRIVESDEFSHTMTSVSN